MAPSEQIAEDIRRQILGGSLAKGAKLPSYRVLASTYNVASMTAQKAVRQLVDEGWVETRGPLGSFVSPAWDKQAPPVTLERLASEVAALRERVARLEED